MEKIIVTKEEFMETAAKVISEIMDRHEDSLGLVLMGTVVIGELTEGLFKEQDSIELSKEEFSHKCAVIMADFAKNPKAKDIATMTIIGSPLIIYPTIDKLFSEESMQERRMKEVADIISRGAEDGNSTEN